MSARDAGVSFLESVLAHVDADHRDTVKAALAANEQVLTELGNGALRQSEFSKLADQARAAEAAAQELYTQNQRWFEENKTRLEAATRTPAPVTSTPSLQSPAADALAALEEKFTKQLQELSQAGSAAIVHTTELATRHMKTFGETLDIQALMRDPAINQLGLQGVYEKTYKDKYAEIAKKADDARIEAAVQQRVNELRLANPRLPYPSQQGGSPLDGLEIAARAAAAGTTPVPTAPVDVVAQAAAEYEAAVARRTA
jgi:DNA primase